MLNLFKESVDTDKDIDWSVFSLLILVIFLILQIACLGKSAHVPEPEELKHVEGRLLRTVLIWNQNIFDAEMLIRSGEGDTLIYVPSVATVPDSIKFIEKNSLLSIDYYPMTSRGVSTLYAWKISLDGKPFVDYYHSTLSKNQLRAFDIKFIAMTALVCVSLLLFILITCLGKITVSSKT